MWPLWLLGFPGLAFSLTPSIHAATMVRILRSSGVSMLIQNHAPLHFPALKDGRFSKELSPDFPRPIYVALLCKTVEHEFIGLIFSGTVHSINLFFRLLPPRTW